MLEVKLNIVEFLDSFEFDHKEQLGLAATLIEKVLLDNYSNESLKTVSTILNGIVQNFGHKKPMSKETPETFTIFAHRIAAETIEGIKAEIEYENLSIPDWAAKNYSIENAATHIEQTGEHFKMVNLEEILDGINSGKYTGKMDSLPCGSGPEPPVNSSYPWWAHDGKRCIIGEGSDFEIVDYSYF